MAKTTASMRGISPQFMKDLKGGVLSPLLELVKADPTLDLQIRDGYINIYYRGGSLLRVEEKKGVYVPFFDQEKQSGTKGYSAQLKALFKKTACPLPLPKPWTRDFADTADVAEWMSSHLSVSKLMMDLSTSIKAERVVQQELVRVNNRSGQANGTDWYIGDLEYAVPVRKPGAVRRSVVKVDMLALHWPSTGPQRKTPDHLEWAMVELKSGNTAIVGSAGLDKRLADMNAMLRDTAWLEEMRSQVRDAINQRIELKLIPELKHTVSSISTKPPLLVFILADVDPATSQFERWLDGLAKQPKEVRDSVRFFVAHLMGYALHDRYLLTVDEVQRYLNQCWKQS